MGGTKGFSQGKKSAKNRAKNAKDRSKHVGTTPGEPDGEPASDAEADLTPEDPPQQPTPPPAATPAAKPRRVPSADLSPGSLDTRRVKKRVSEKQTAQKKQAAAAAPPVELPAEPYATTKLGKQRAGGKNALKLAKSRDIAAVSDLLESLGDESQQAQVLKDLSESSRMGRVAAAAGYIKDETTATALFAQQQSAAAMVHANAAPKRGRATDDRRSFVEAVLVAQAPSAESVNVPPLNARARATGLPLSTGKKRIKEATVKRALLMGGETELSWACVKERQGHSEITLAVKELLHAWVLNHPRVVNSPIANETLLVTNPQTGERERVSKLLREITIREMHNDLIALPVSQGGLGGGLPEVRNAKGKIIISDTALRYLLPEQLKPMTEKHKQMCGCETCLVPDSHQKSLNAWRARTKRVMTEEAAALADGAAKVKAVAAAFAYQDTLNLTPPSPWHAKPGLALGEIQCQPVREVGFPHWNCVLRRCLKCPKYPVPLEEQGTGSAALRIRFHVYTTATRCTRHGPLTPGAKVCAECTTDPGPPPPKKQARVSSRKGLTEMQCAIGTFHENYYQPALEKLAYHRQHCRILGKDHCGAERLAAFKRKPSVRTRRDYAERLAAAFNLEAQFEHFGNGRTLSMEGSSVETFVKAAIEAFMAGVWQMDEDDLKMVFHSHLSDESKQDAATTHAHMLVLFTELKEIGELCAGLTVWDDTDGCGKQYRCGTALYLLSVLAGRFGIVIDRAIGAPGHGKDIVDGLNATDKVYLKKAMCMVGTPEADDGATRMAAHSMIGDDMMSLAAESQRLLSNPLRFGGVKSEGGKRAKREKAAKMMGRRYHVQNPADVKFGKLNMSAVGFMAGEHNGLLAHYNFQVSKDLGVGRAATRRIPCACEACLTQMDEPWKPGVAAEEQPRYASSTGCLRWKIFVLEGQPGINDWKIIDIGPKKVSDPKEEEEAHAQLLEGVMEMMAETVKANQYGAFSTEDEDADGYYIVKWTSDPYTLQEDVELPEYTPAMKIKAGALVCDAEYYNKLPQARLWYTPTKGEERKTLVRMVQVVAADLKLAPISETNALPSNMKKANKNTALKLGAVRLTNEAHEVIQDEIVLRERLELEEVDLESDSESEEDEDEEDEEDGEEDGVGG